jgi:asparagine synthase (glutamine-hydrolysing)
MTDRLAHRGPDDHGAWIDAAAGIGLGFRRLAILDLSPAGHQPMISASGRFVITFNGEIYNFAELRTTLEGHGVRFRGHSDTEVIVEAVDRWGVAAVLPQLWGMFALALWDRERRVLAIARDRLGKKPLYYGRCGDTWLFGSELKALRAHPSFAAPIDRDALAAYLRFGYVPGPRSIHAGVAKLPAGSWCELADGVEAVPRAYWSAREVARAGFGSPRAVTDEAAADELDALLRDAVARRMVADVPLGAFLSGGLDSSTVVALMQAQSTRPVKTFTIGFAVEGYDEAQAARAVAQHLGTEHTELYVTPEEARAVIPRLPAIYDEPFADSSQIPTLLVAGLARRHVTVALSGDGGDELFAGYTRYTWAEDIWRRVGRLPSPVRGALAAGLRGVSPAAWDMLHDALRRVTAGPGVTHAGDKIHKLAAIVGAASPDDLYRRLVSQWQNPAALVVRGREVPTLLDDASVEPEFTDFTARMMFLDLVTYLPEDILVKVDRATMAVSLEGRCPLLDHRLVEFAWRLPMSLKRRDGTGKWLLRRVLHRYVPAPLVERPKMGFGIPIDHWLRGPLRDWADALLDARRLRDDGFLLPDPVQRAWREHLSGQRNHQYKLWAVLMFQAWLDHVRAERTPTFQAA